MAILNGTPVNFGFTGAADGNFNSGITSANISGVLLQSVDITSEAEMEMVKNGVGDDVLHGHYNLHKTATLEYVVTGTNIAGSITNTTPPTIGSFISITVCASMPELVSTIWEVQRGAKRTKSNTGAAKMTVPLMLCPNITAVAT